MKKLNILYQDWFCQIPCQRIDMPGYFISSDEKYDRPCVILVNGLDSAKEVELFAFAKEFISRGLSVLIFDAPGQGILLGKFSQPENFEEVIESCINFLLSNQLVRNSIGLFGVSFGGYLVLRASSFLGNRVKACINLSGGFDIDNYESLSPRIKHDFSYVFRKYDSFQMQEFAEKKLNLKNLRKPICPVLCIHGGQDNIFLPQSLYKIIEWCNDKALLKFYPHEHHVCQNYFHEYVSFMCDWMSDQLK